MVLPIKPTSMKQPAIVFLEHLSQLAKAEEEKTAAKHNDNIVDVLMCFANL